MDSARWERVQALFHDVVDLPPGERRRRLEVLSPEDPDLVSEVLRLLAEDEASTFLDRDVAEVARGVLEQRPEDLMRLRFGPYRLREVLGEGGMGVVYLAEREDLRSVVALKILRDSWLSPARRERFLAEQRTLAQLTHPSIARLCDAGALDDGTPWFVMEYVAGQPLTAYCQAHAPTVAQRLRIFRTVAEAVQHAHQHAVIHRDLKPSNVLVTELGEVKLLDFGIAKQLEALDAAPEITRTALRFLTPAYAPPEQFRGEAVGIHTDVYSLGVILYELLTGRLPFDLAGLAAGQAEERILHTEPTRPSTAAMAVQSAAAPVDRHSLGRGAWGDLDVLCLTAMHQDPGRRYRTVDALIRDIDHYLAAEPLEARPDSAAYRLNKFVRRHRTAVASAAAVALVLLGLVGFYTLRLTTARNAALAEAARTERIQRFMLNLFQGGDEAAGPADSLRVVSVLDRGVQEAEGLSGEPAVQAELRQTLGGLYQKLGNLGRADTLLTEALAQRRALFGPEHPDVAKSLVALGLLRSDQADYAAAEQLVRDGLAMSRRSLPQGSPAVADALGALGHVLDERGAYDQAISVFDSFVTLRRTDPRPTPELDDALYELANAHFYAGHLQVSDSLNQLVLQLSQQLYGPRHPRVADALINLGAVQHEEGHYGEAEHYFRQALDINEGWYGRDHYQTASNLTMLGRTLLFEQKLDEGRQALEQALAIQERIFGPVHPRVASALNDLGNLAIMQDRLDEAERDYTRIVAIYREVYHDHHYLIGVAVSNLAGVYLARKDYPRAEALYREALRRFAETLPAMHLNVGIAHLKLGRTLLRAGQYVDATRETRAGYDIVKPQVGTANNFLHAARKDLATEYAALGDTANAARFRRELVDTFGGAEHR